MSAVVNIAEADLKQTVKEALAETLNEQRELLHDVFVEVIEDLALAEAIRKGRETETVDREEVLQLLKDQG